MAKEYNITKTVGRCSGCDEQMQPGQEFVATVREVEQDDEVQFVRQDFCPGCWGAAGGDGQEAPEVFGIWRSRVPQPKERRKTFVDNEILMDFFRRLDGADEPARVQFRFVLALILMRKKLLIYDRSAAGDDGADVWAMHFRGQDQSCRVVDPHLDEDKIAEVSQQLGDILEGEL